jgi:hypothetical protein
MTSVEWRHDQTPGCELAVAEQVPAVCDVLATIDSRDWLRLERLLDPDVHWTTSVEEHLHGPAEVIVLLADDLPRPRRRFTKCATG